MDSYEVIQGDAPLLVSMPHVGTQLPEDLKPRLTAAARQLADTDWRVDELYSFLGEMGVSRIRARYSRYVVDLNRFASGDSLYPGQAVTDICPLQTFSGRDIYLDGCRPDAEETGRRIADFWSPYHDALAEELRRLQRRHGYALLWDAHSIRSEVPRLFEGRLPDLNFGTADGLSCHPGLLGALESVAAAHGGYTHVSNGRFKGGAITRRYGRPAEGVHAVQLELSQATYLQQESPAPGPLDAPGSAVALCEQRSNNLRPLLRSLLEAALNWTPIGDGA